VCLPLYLLALEQCRGERRGGMCSRLPERQVESAPDGRRRRRRPVLPSWRPGYCVATTNRRRSAPADVNLAPGSKPESGRPGEVQSDQPSSGHPARPCPAPKLRRISAERGAAPSGGPATRATMDASADPRSPVLAGRGGPRRGRVRVDAVRASVVGGAKLHCRRAAVNAAGCVRAERGVTRAL